MSVTVWIYLGLLALGMFLLSCYHKTGRLLKCTFFTLFTGLGTLGVLWLLRNLIAIPLSITPLTLLVSGILGIPGVIGMLILFLI